MIVLRPSFSRKGKFKSIGWPDLRLSRIVPVQRVFYQPEIERWDIV
jgi:hypothetical protein